MDSLEEQILNTFKSLITKRVKVHSVILFGSRARGDADPDSDMDVLVVAEEVTTKLEDYVSECAWKAGFDHGIVIVPVIYSRHEWEDGPDRYSLLAEAVRSEGIHL